VGLGGAAAGGVDRGGESERRVFLPPASLPPVATGICGGSGGDSGKGEVSGCGCGGGGGIEGGSG
jgi:hypothetical protein